MTVSYMMSYIWYSTDNPRLLGKDNMASQICCKFRTLAGNISLKNRISKKNFGNT